MTSRADALALRATFLLTGMGIALLGATLPATLLHHHLTDSAGGTLLLAGWGGSTSGALLARGRLTWAAALGCLFSAAALLLISLRFRQILGLAYLLYGTGLGLTMTAISLLRSRQVVASQVNLELNQLNLLWALGACLTPVLTLHSLQKLSVSTLYDSVAIIFVCAAAAMWITSQVSRQHLTPAALTGSQAPNAWAPWRFSIFAAASVGLESGVGSWLTTYSQRLTHDVRTAVTANSAFWLGLLVSRALHSVSILAGLHTRLARALHLMLILCGILLLLGFPGSLTLPLAGALCGFGLGPLYPYALSISLPRYRSTLVFMLAGIGASAVPFFTGILSTRTGSLQKGMLVPAFTLAVLIGAYVVIEAREQPDLPSPQG